MAIKIYDDRMTLAMTEAPQVYLYGYIDADAPARFSALMKSWKIPTGSDIYLNSPGGDLKAGLALGRLFRAGSMVTHLGTPTRGPHQSVVNKNAVCIDACAYAYMGGLYRWAPSGSDHLGITPQGAEAAHAPSASAEVDAYLKDMGVKPDWLASASTPSHDATAWLDADRMLASGLANNGRLNLFATYKLLSGAPYLELKQTDRHGDHRITLLCKPDGAQLAAYNTAGSDRARQIVARGTRSYLEIDRQPVLVQEQDGATLEDQSVVIRRTYPLAQLQRIASAQSLGAWVEQRSSSFRYGFGFEVTGVRNVLKAFYDNCLLYAPSPATQNP
ncbi:hypothetical protein ISP15_05090 [Dyella jejuensis]|uniref:Uncharacterized protein n=1 Tax=Dyella jejuensis TaxID=1432009 RepID=A0ABW8JF38_9GAMM